MRHAHARAVRPVAPRSSRFISAASLAERAVVEAFKTTAAFTLAPAKGTANPPACAAVPAVSPALTSAAAPGPAVGGPVPNGARRTGPYTPAPTTVSLTPSAVGSWYTPTAVTVSVPLSANGIWYSPAPVTIDVALSATGSWLEPRGAAGSKPLQTPQPK